MYLNGAVLSSSRAIGCLEFFAYINSYSDRINYSEAWYKPSQIQQSSGDRLDDDYEARDR
jgi:hypothetical protein